MVKQISELKIALGAKVDEERILYITATLKKTYGLIGFLLPVSFVAQVRKETQRVQQRRQLEMRKQQELEMQKKLQLQEQQQQQQYLLSKQPQRNMTPNLTQPSVNVYNPIDLTGNRNMSQRVCFCHDLF